MKKLMLKVLGVAVVMIAFSVLTSCEKQVSEDVLATEETKLQELDTDCMNSLPYMREEEKLAHDVYVNMYELWSIPVFDHISNSETIHTEAIKGLLDFYGMDDPALPGIGEFTNPDLQQLYDDLMNIGNASLIDGLIVGATIEEVDIIDLRDAIENCTEDTIVAVYSRLKRASGFHLKAFVAQLAFRDYVYTPQYLTQEEFDEIINGTNTGGGGCGDTTFTTITAEEEAGLLFMREEEKLAHDIYVNMFELWGMPVFDNISKSETIHTNRILALINYFDLEDPALPGIGEFSNTDLQDLYDQLMIQGSDSLVAGLIVGATIEEVDILDLLTHLETTENPSISMVYTNLEKGSEAHLRAFVNILAFQGYTYEPQFLSQELFDEIMGN